MPLWPWIFITKQRAETPGIVTSGPLASSLRLTQVIRISFLILLNLTFLLKFSIYFVQMRSSWLLYCLVGYGGCHYAWRQQELDAAASKGPYNYKYKFQIFFNFCQDHFSIVVHKYHSMLFIYLREKLRSQLSSLFSY